MDDSHTKFEELDTQERLAEDFVFFVDYVHKHLEDAPFEWSGYNKKIVKALMEVHKLQLLLLIINIPPRLGKTTLVLYFIAWTMFKNARVYNNYYSYSDLLVKKGYKIIARIFKLPAVHEAVESTYKRTDEDFANEKGGGLFAQTTFGQVTGFGAGRKEDIDEFNGAIFIDDPHKAQDTIVRIINANKAIEDSIPSRKNNSKVPIVLIMQRLHKLDLTAFLMDYYEDWFADGRAKQLLIPARLNGKSISTKEYPLDMLEIEEKKSPNKFWCQLMQEPLNVDGKYFKEINFEQVEEVKHERVFVTFSFNHEEPNEPIVLLAFKKEGNNAQFLKYQEEVIEAGTFFVHLKDFAKEYKAKKVYVPKHLINKTLAQEIKPLKIEEIEEESNLELSAYYSVGLLKDGGKIQIVGDEGEAIKEELKLFPNAKRDFTTKSAVNALQILFVMDKNRISGSL